MVGEVLDDYGVGDVFPRTQRVVEMPAGECRAPLLQRAHPEQRGVGTRRRHGCQRVRRRQSRGDANRNQRDGWAKDAPAGTPHAVTDQRNDSQPVIVYWMVAVKAVLRMVSAGTPTVILLAAWVHVPSASVSPIASVIGNE